MNFVRNFIGSFVVTAFVFCVGGAYAYLQDLDVEDVYLDTKAPPYAPNVLCGKKNAKSNDPSTALKLDVVSADSSLPRFDENFVIPYIGMGGSLKIDGRWYSASEMVGMVDAARTNIMLALRGNMRENKDTLLLDLPGLKKTMDSLNIRNSSLRRFSRFFSGIGLNVGRGANTKLRTIDLLALKGDSCFSDDFVYLSGLDFKLNTDSVQLDFGLMKKQSALNTTVSFDFKYNKDKNGSAMKTNFESFVLEMPGLTDVDTKSWPTQVQGGNFKIFLSKDGAKDNLQLSREIEPYFSLKDFYEPLEKIEIPFLESKKFSFGKTSYSLGDIAKNIDNYFRVAEYAIDATIGDDDLIILAEAKKILDSVFVEKLPLGGVAFLNHALQDVHKEYSERNFVELYGDSLPAVSGKVKLRKGKNYIVFKVRPKTLKYKGNVDTGLLSAKDVDASVNFYVKVLVYVTDANWLVYDEIILDKVDVSLSAQVPSMEVGLFTVKFDNARGMGRAKLLYDVSVKPTVADSILKPYPSMVLTFDSLSLMADHSTVMHLKNKGGKDKFTYDFNRGEWIVPAPLKRFASFSGEDLLTHVYAVENALRELRNHVEGSAKADSVGEAVKNVAAVVEKMDRVVFVDTSNYGRYGLVKNVGAKYRKSFGDVLDFAEKFNGAWKNILGTEGTCKVEFLDAKKKAVPVEKNQFKGNVAYAKISFDLNFGLRPDFGQELVKILRKRLADFPTKPQVALTREGNLALDFLVEIK
ncbi:hypothetical protein [Fibrobacter succinogenes]|uniref:hypothetical protein n=1 Tax=Fibrobacter succinogenes TaxID=833 RepID=UPI001566A559|nr:hypothetical protein [Fibrobacter succinogenes]